MLIWYANVGEETVYFKTRYQKFPVLFYANLVINFLVPFFILMRNDTKRKFGSLIFTAMVVIFGHWIDFFLMIKPGVSHTRHELGAHAHGDTEHGGHAAEALGHGVEHAGTHGEAIGHAAHGSSTFEAGFTLPGFLEFGTFLGFLCLFLFVFYHFLTKSSLVAKNDPYLSESLHHHV